MRVFLLGAGASHSYDLSPTGVRPPLARGIFDAYNKLPMAADRFVLVGNLVNYVKRTRGVDPLHFGRWNEDAETFLTEVDNLIATREAALALDLGERFEANGVFNECVFLFASILNEIQNGPLCNNYSKLVGSLGDDDVVVTFNWDTLLDRVLAEQGAWSPADGYGLRFRLFYNDRWVQTLPASTRGIKLLKLHGSTNWLIPYFSLNLESGSREFLNAAMESEARPLLCFVQSSTPYKTYDNRTRSGYAPYSYYYYPPDMPGALGTARTGFRSVRAFTATDLGRTGEIQQLPRGPVETMPFLVAPVLHKDLYLLDDALRDVWAQAEDAIAGCDELIICGYSFPATDLKAWDLMAGALLRRGRGLKITVVNPSASELATRLAGLGERCELTVRSEKFDTYVGTL